AGRIINVTTVGGKAPAARSLPTSVTRAAGINLTKSLANEYAVDKILVNTVCLGLVKSAQWERRAKGDLDAYYRDVARRVPLGRVGEAQEFADLVAFLASERAAYITGTAINFDRSLSAQAREAGAVIATGARVSSISLGDDGVDVAAGERRVRARACVLACGVCYRFQRLLGLGLPGRVLHTAQLEVDAVAADGIDLHVGRRVAPDGFAWVVPVRRAGRDRLKIGVMASGDAGACLDRLVARADLRQRLLAEPGPPVRRPVP